MPTCTPTAEVILFVTAALGIGLALVCLTIAAGFKARADAWERAYLDIVSAAKPVADAMRFGVIDGGRTP